MLNAFVSEPDFKGVIGHDKHVTVSCADHHHASDHAAVPCLGSSALLETLSLA